MINTKMKSGEVVQFVDGRRGRTESVGEVTMIKCKKAYGMVCTSMTMTMSEYKEYEWGGGGGGGAERSRVFHFATTKPCTSLGGSRSTVS
jgi:hypothetical protein